MWAQDAFVPRTERGYFSSEASNRFRQPQSSCPLLGPRDHVFPAGCPAVPTMAPPQPKANY
eukprot:7007929-Pyramimonas_sp.AAC.1